MADTEIERDAEAILAALVEWQEYENDPNVGNYQVEGAELQEKLDIPTSRIVDAVELLYSQGYIERVRAAGAAPHNLRNLRYLPEGKLAFQSAKLEASNATAEESISATKYDVFLSHSSLDDDLASDVKTLLTFNGIRVFSTPGSIPTGAWERQIEQALQGSSTIWLLLTENALRTSLWSHHEFGYFYGHSHGKGRDAEGHNCRFLYATGTELRGLYEWIQGTEVDSLEDPIVVAETIANGMNRSFHVPCEWVNTTCPQNSKVTVRHPQLGPVGVSTGGAPGSDDTGLVTLEIREIDTTVYYVDALIANPDIEMVRVKTADVVSPSHRETVKFEFRYRKERHHSLPDLLSDSRGREFRVVPGPRCPQGKFPLFITFETDDARALAAVFYYSVSRHSKGFPELQLHRNLPMDWQEGRMPPM